MCDNASRVRDVRQHATARFALSRISARDTHARHRETVPLARTHVMISAVAWWTLRSGCEPM
eukprot:1044793-Lingulodinium_polyedra.AAC.1